MTAAESDAMLILKRCVEQRQIDNASMSALGMHIATIFEMQRQGLLRVNGLAGSTFSLEKQIEVSWTHDGCHKLPLNPAILHFDSRSYLHMAELHSDEASCLFMHIRTEHLVNLCRSIKRQAFLAHSFCSNAKWQAFSSHSVYPNAKFKFSH